MKFWSQETRGREGGVVRKKWSKGEEGEKEREGIQRGIGSIRCGRRQEQKELVLVRFGGKKKRVGSSGGRGWRG